MNNWFLNRLNKALAHITNPHITESIDPDNYLQFINTIMTSANQERIDQALHKIATLDQEQLTTIIAQTTTPNDTTYAAIKRKQPLIPTIITIAKKLFNDTEIATITDKLSPQKLSDINNMYDTDLISLNRDEHGIRNRHGIIQTDQDGNRRVASWNHTIQYDYVSSYEAYEYTEKPGTGYVRKTNRGLGSRVVTDQYGAPGQKTLEEIINSYLELAKIADSAEEYDEAGDYYYQGDDGGGH